MPSLISLGLYELTDFYTHYRQCFIQIPIQVLCLKISIYFSVLYARQFTGPYNPGPKPFRNRIPVFSQYNRTVHRISHCQCVMKLKVSFRLIPYRKLFLKCWGSPHNVICIYKYHQQRPHYRIIYIAQLLETMENVICVIYTWEKSPIIPNFLWRAII